MIFIYIFVFIDKVEQVKNAMANFTLPHNSIPEWAKELSDDKLMNSLAESVLKRSKSSKWLHQRRKSEESEGVKYPILKDQY